MRNPSCRLLAQAMYTRPEEFGGSLFSLAVSVMTDLIHHEPQSFRQLNEAGLPDAFLAAIKVRHSFCWGRNTILPATSGAAGWLRRVHNRQACPTVVCVLI